MQFHALAVLLMASGAGVVSHDMRYNTLQLFFSKPIERWEYTLGKFVGLMVIGSTVTVLPAIGVGGLRTAMLYQHGMAKAVGIDAAIGVGLSLMLTALLSMLMIGLSSMTRRTGLVILTFIGVLFFPPVASIILGLTVDNGDIAGLASLQGNLQMLSDVLVTDRTLEIPVWSPGLLLAVVTGGAYGLHHWRLRSLEGVS
jgi:ABC-type transport system involved in multi-copper enzyme maturation permease subunit